MASAVDESPVWKPRTTMTLTLPGPSAVHRGHSVKPAAVCAPDASRASAPRDDARSRKPFSDYTLSTFRPGPPPPPPPQGTWPGARLHQSQSDPLLDRTPAFGGASPLHGSILRPIREHHAEAEPPAPADGLTPSTNDGASTTAPPNVAQRNPNDGGAGAGVGHRPSASRGSRLSKLRTSRETWEVRCCRVSVLLVIMQICLGVTVTALGFYMERLSSSIPTKECPYWAGIPLLIAGVLGIYFCATDFVAYTGSTQAFIIKALCFVLSFVCVFLCTVAAVFPGIHGHRIPTYSQCRYARANMTCVCLQPLAGLVREFHYGGVADCVAVSTSVKDILILQCALNAVAGGVSLWFVTLLWKKRYAEFHSGLRFYSYSAAVPPHP